MSAVEAKDARGSFALLLTASLTCSLIMLDSNIVAVSLPAIARSLGATFASIEWVITAYVLTFAALLLAAGSLADRHGRRRCVLAGLASFAVASALCGLAQNGLVLDVARALQGIGASLLLTSALAIINHAFTGAERARAYAFWGSCIGIAITAGPIVGGVITSASGWRWVFLVNIPLCAALIVAVLRYVRESSDPDARKLDYLGIVTFSCALFLAIWALVDGNAIGWSSATILSRFGGSIAIFVAFVFVELRETRPMVDFTLFAQRAFLGSTFAMFGFAAAAQVMIFYLPLYLQNAYGFAPFAAGLAMIPFALPMFLTPRLGAAFAANRSSRFMLSLGLAITTAGNVAFATAAYAGSSYAVFACCMIFAGCGAGVLNSETAKAMQSAVPPQRAGMASGLSATTRFTGLLLGVAVLGAVLAQAVSSDFVARARTAGIAEAIAREGAKRVTSGDVAGVLAAIPAALHDAMRVAGQSAFAHGFGTAAVAAAAFAAIAGLLTFTTIE